MKLLMLIGALVGFGVGFLFSLLRESPWPNVVWHACIAAYAAGMMLRWWGRRWEENLRHALVEREQAAVRSQTTSTPDSR